jgi:[protein-PII] uridylyltransferase
VLTCADVRGTNPKLWNSWKASLFHEFYTRVKRALRRGLESPIDQDELMRETQEAARKLLVDQHVTEPDVQRVWTRLSATYFLRHSPEEVAWHTRMLADRPANSTEPLVAIEPQSLRGTTGVLVYGLPGRYGFARPTAVLDQHGLTILEARITPIGGGISLDFYHVLEDDNAPITDSDRQQEIERALWQSVRRPEDAPVAVSRRAPRQARMFNTPTQIAVSVDERNQRSVLELTAGDRPGLLCDVGKVLLDERIELHNAKIMTVGERAEDVFYVTGFDHRPLTEEAAERLKSRLTLALDRRQAA